MIKTHSPTRSSNMSEVQKPYKIPSRRGRRGRRGRSSSGKANDAKTSDAKTSCTISTQTGPDPTSKVDTSRYHKDRVEKLLYKTRKYCGYGCGGPTISRIDRGEFDTLLKISGYEPVEVHSVPTTCTVKVGDRTFSTTISETDRRTIIKTLREDAIANIQDIDMIKAAAQEWIESVSPPGDRTKDVYKGEIGFIEGIKGAPNWPTGGMNPSCGGFNEKYSFDWPSPLAVMGLTILHPNFVIGIPPGPTRHGN